MNRVALQTQFESYRTSYAEERALIPEFLNLIQDPKAFLRERLEGHFTASAWIVNPERTHTLLLLHRKLGKWLQPGGHADGEENLLEVALKEAREECGLHAIRVVTDQIFDLDRHGIPAQGQVPAHSHFDVRYLLEADRSDTLQKNHESISLKWIPLSAVATYVGCSPSILRMVYKTSTLSQP